jgi:hypothetical protein
VTNAKLGNTASLGPGEAAALLDGQPEPAEELPLPEGVDRWHYVSLK